MNHLHVAYHGQGPALMLLAGTGGRVDFWTGALPILSDAHSVLAFDYRDAPSWDGETPYETFERKAQDAKSVWEAEGLSEVTLVAHSSGCHVAAHLAAAFPETVSRLILSGGWAGPHPYVQESFGLRKRILTEMRPEAFVADSLFRSTPPDVLSAKLQETDMAALTGYREAVDVKLETARIDMILGADSQAALPNIKAQTLVLCAEDDTVFPPSFTKDIAACIPDAQTKFIPRGGHLAPMTEAALWANAVGEFLEAPHDD